MSEVCSNVAVEPYLQPVTGKEFDGASATTDDGARLNIAADGIWGGSHERTFFDVRIFNLHVHSNRDRRGIAAVYWKHEAEKRRVYEQRILEIEHATFIPLVMSTASGLANSATILYKRLASILSQKWDQPYATTMGWLRCRLSFSLLHSSIRSIRGARSSSGAPQKFNLLPVDLVVEETLGSFNSLA